MNLTLTGNFSGTSFDALDPETGFLTKSKVVAEVARRKDGTFDEGNGSFRFPVFDVALKLRALNLLLDWWPNISKVCAMIGISKETFRNHYTADESFRQCVDEMRDRVIDHIEHRRMIVADTNAGSFDRMCVLNAYRAETYNPKVKIEVEHTLTVEEGRKRLDALSGAIDTEVVDTVRKIKAQRQKGLAPKTQTAWATPK